MVISETAQKNHDELFPGHASTLKVTDPELVEVFDTFAFDEVLRHSSLDTRIRLMVQLAALIGAQALSEYRVMLGAALTIGVTSAEAREIVYQAVPTPGWARSSTSPPRHQRRPGRTRRPAASGRAVHHHPGDPYRTRPGGPGADRRGGPGRADVRVGSRCWRPSADATPRSAGTWRPT
jgi:alkylhydroperoxidase/carboxymuconolactone decarboxylase family protein YurZ